MECVCPFVRNILEKIFQARARSKPKFGRPEPDAQFMLEHLALRPRTPQERHRCEASLEEHHYLHSHQWVGEQLGYMATCPRPHGAGDDRVGDVWPYGDQFCLSLAG